MSTASTVLIAGVVVVVVGSVAYAWAVQRDSRDAAVAAQPAPTSGLAGSSQQGADLGNSIVQGLTQIAIAGAHVYESQAAASRTSSTSPTSGTDIHSLSGSSSPAH